MQAPSAQNHTSSFMDSTRSTLSARLQVPRLARSLSFSAAPWARRPQVAECAVRQDAKSPRPAISQLVSNTIAFLVLTPPYTTSPPTEDEDREFESTRHANPHNALATRSLNLLKPKSVPNLRGAQKDQKAQEAYASSENLKPLPTPLVQNNSPILIVAPENMPLGHNLINLVGSRDMSQNVGGIPVAPSPTLVGASLHTGQKQLSLHYASLYLSIQGADPVIHQPPSIHESPQISTSVMPNLSPLRITHMLSPTASDSLKDDSTTTQYFTPATSPLANERTRPSGSFSTPSPSFSPASLSRSSPGQVSTTDAETSIESSVVGEEANRQVNHEVEISRDMLSVSESDLIRDITADMDVLLMASPMGGRIQQTESMEFKGRRWDRLDKPTVGSASPKQPNLLLSQCRPFPSSSSILRPLTQADFDASFEEVFQGKRKQPGPSTSILDDSVMLPRLKSGLSGIPRAARTTPRKL